MTNRNGLLARLGILFRTASPEQLNDLTNEIIADEAGLPGPEHALFKNSLSEALHNLATPSADYQADAMRVPQTGRRQAASGGGAAAMTAEFSDVSAQNMLTEAYARLGKELDETNKRVEKAEKAVAAAISMLGDSNKRSLLLEKALIAIAKGERFPEDGQHVGEKAESSAEEEKDDDSAAQKGELPVISVKNLIEAVNAKANRVSPPPVFSKANPSAAMSVDAALDGLNDIDALQVASYMQRRAHVAAGRADAAILNMPLSAAARSVLGLA